MLCLVFVFLASAKCFTRAWDVLPVNHKPALAKTLFSRFSECDSAIAHFK